MGIIGKLADFFVSNIATVLVLFVLAVLVALIIIFTVRAKKRGRSSCGCGCGGCPMSGKCHGAKSESNSDN